MTTVLIYAEERSSLPGNAPETAAIRAALSTARIAGVLPTTIPIIGDWVGDAPRVTRAIDLGPPLPLVGSIPTFVTRVAWPYTWDEARWPGIDQKMLSDWLNKRVTDALAQDSDDWTVFDPRPFDPRAYGDLAWWRSGAAATSPTYINTWPTVGSADNPTAPNGTPPAGVFETIGHLPADIGRALFDFGLGQAEHQATKLWPLVLVAGGVLAAVYLGPPLIAAATAPSVSSKPTAPSNRGSK